MSKTQLRDCEDPCKRKSLYQVGQVIVATAVVPALGLTMPRPAHAVFWVVPTIAFLVGYGLKELVQAISRSEQRHAQQRLRDRMGAFDWPDRNSASAFRMHLGRAGDSAGPATMLAWPELGYHDAKVKEGADYRHPISPPEHLAMSDREIFQEALRSRVPGLMSSSKAYARDYVDRNGNKLRIVAAQLPGGQTHVAESDGREVIGYKVEARVG